jgi:benzoylformate decarboxylase
LPHGLPHRLASQPQAERTAPQEGRLGARELFDALYEVRPPHAVLVEESPSNLAELHAAWPITEPDTFYTFASGGLGWNTPAAVGIALAERDRGEERPVVAVIGDGSFQYSLQAIWTAARERLPILFVVLRNDEYAILKAFAVLEGTPGVPGLEVPGIDVVALADGYGCHAVRVETADAMRAEAREAFGRTGPTVLEVAISHAVPSLL